MHRVIFLISLWAFANSQNLVLDAPKPYQFSYSAPAIGGGSSHEQSGDGYGRVTGSYTVEDEDGRQRIVNYVADEGGFRASISTNEPGTANQNPADVTIASSADDGTQTLESPSSAVIPFGPTAPRAPTRIVTPVARTPTFVTAPLQRPTFVPIQPAVFQPTLIPFDSRRLQPISVEAIGGSRFTIPSPGYPLQNFGQPTLIPLTGGVPFNPYGVILQ